jgi:glycosyltransferase involved in cell wall biosynthesis
MRIGVAILTLNEIDGVREIVPRLPPEYLPDTFAVDGGSTDGTLEFFAGQGMRVFGQSRRGRGEAFRMAFENTDYDAIVFFSPDGNEDPEDIPRLADAIGGGADMAIATRMARDSYNEEDDSLFRPRKWANQALTLLANLRWNAGFLIRRSSYITDTINGFRAIRRDAFEAASTDAAGYAIEYQLSIRFLKMHKVIREIPTRELARIGGESYARSWDTGKKLLATFFRELV